MDVKGTTEEITRMAGIVADYEARINTLEQDAYKILGDQLKLNTEFLSDEGLDRINDAINTAFVEIRDSAIANIAEQSALLSRATGAVSHLPVAVGRSAILNLYKEMYSDRTFALSYCADCGGDTPSECGNAIQQCLICGQDKV